MALFEEPEEQTLPVRDDPIKIKTQPEEYTGITIDTKYEDTANLQLWINGSNWTVDYFSQILGPTTEPTTQNLERKPIYQQYRRIRKLPLKVNRSLEGTHTEDIDRFSVTGSGHTYPFLTPNKGDMFIGNIGDGKLGLFTITERRRETFLRNSTYAIEWKMVQELDSVWMADLELKTMQTLVYSESNLVSGCGPFISAEADADAAWMMQLYNELVRRYLTDFFSPEHHTLLVPDQLEKVYDHFAVKAFTTMIGPSTDIRVSKIRILNVQSEPVMNQPTVWDALIRHDPARSYDSTERAFLVPTRISRWRPELQAIGYSGIARFVFPIDAPTDVDSQYDLEDRFRPQGTPLREGRPRRPLPGPYRTQAQRDLKWFRRVPPEVANAVEAWTVPPDIHPIVKDTHYMFSEPFYRCDGKLQSKLEMLVKQMINREALDLRQLKSVLADCLNWDNLERYYYHVVLLAVIKYAVGAKINVRGL